MKTTRQVRLDKGIAIPYNKDSEYRVRLHSTLSRIYLQIYFKLFLLNQISFPLCTRSNLLYLFCSILSIISISSIPAIIYPQPITRKEPRFHQLKIPDSLQKALPFKSKNKTVKKNPGTLEARRAVVLEPKEKQIMQLMQQLNTIKNEKIRKKKESTKARFAEHLKQKAKEDKVRDSKEKEKKRKIFKRESLMNMRLKRKKTDIE